MNVNNKISDESMGNSESESSSGGEETDSQQETQKNDCPQLNLYNMSQNSQKFTYNNGIFMPITGQTPI